MEPTVTEQFPNLKPVLDEHEAIKAEITEREAALDEAKERLAEVRARAFSMIYGIGAGDTLSYRYGQDGGRRRMVVERLEIRQFPTGKGLNNERFHIWGPGVLKDGSLGQRVRVDAYEDPRVEEKA